MVCPITRQNQLEDRWATVRFRAVEGTYSAICRVDVLMGQICSGTNDYPNPINKFSSVDLLSMISLIGCMLAYFGSLEITLGALLSSFTSFNVFLQ